MNTTAIIPEDLSKRIVKLARHIQALPDGKYVISLVKSQGNTHYVVTIVRQETVVNKHVFID